MPTTQVINYQQDPGQQMMLEAGKSIADTIQKAQALKLTGEYYKILAKNAQTEQDKFRFDRLAKLNSDILPQIANAKDPATKSMLMKGVVQSGMYDGDANTFYHDIADSHKIIQDNHANVTGQLDAMQPEPGQSYASEGQLRGAQVSNQNAEAQTRGVLASNQLAVANLLRQKMGQQPLPDSMLNGGQAPAATNPNTNTVNAIQPQQTQQLPTQNGGMNDVAITGITGGQPNITFPGDAANVKRAEAYATAAGTDMGKRDIAQQKFTQDFSEFKLLNDQLPRSEGGMLDRTLKGGSLIWAGLNQDSREGQLVKAFDGAANRLATTIARQTDVGNLSETEQSAAKKLVPSKFDSKGVSDIKMAFIADINRPLGTQSPDKLKQIIDNYSLKVKDAEHPGTPRAKAVSNLQGATPKTLDINTARALLQQANGDKNAAREMARQQGYTL